MFVWCNQTSGSAAIKLRGMKLSVTASSGVDTKTGIARYQLGRVIVNRYRQSRRPDRKIFIIGPDHCATSTLHNFFKKQGLKSIHAKSGEVNLTLQINNFLGDDSKLRRFLMPWTVFSDFVYLTDEKFIEAHTEYKVFERLFPEAYFIFNDRNVERWIASRLRHRNGTFLARCMNAANASAQDVMDQWRTDFLRHRAAVLSHFKDHPRFLHFEIDRGTKDQFVEADDIDNLLQLLGTEFSLSKEDWVKKHLLSRR